MGDNGKITTWADMDQVISPMTWEWYLHLPGNLLTILASLSGEGKSYVLMYLCGCYLVALPWPDGTPFTGETGCILWIEAEAAQALNLDRAKVLSLPLEKIYTPFSDPLADFRFDNKAHRQAVYEKAFLPEVKFIAYDSLSGSTGRDENSTEIKQVTEWLSQLARDAKKPILLSHHLRKRNAWDGETITLDRLRGSSAIVQNARCVWALDAPNPDNPEHKRLQVIKSNLGRFPKPIGLTINDQGIIWNDAPMPPQPETAITRAVDILSTILAREPVLTNCVKEQTDAAGISWRSVNEAKKALRIIAVKRGTAWYWSLPAREAI